MTTNVSVMEAIFGGKGVVETEPKAAKVPEVAEVPRNAQGELVRYPLKTTIKASAEMMALDHIDFGAVKVPVVQELTIEGMGQVPTIDPAYRMDLEDSVILASALAHNEPTWVWGPKGSGKTSAIEQMCAILGWPLYRINLQDGFDVPEFVGKTEVVIDKDTGQAITSFIDGVLLRAMRNHGVLLIDEITAAPPGVLLALQAVLEARGSDTARFVNTANHSETVYASPRFRVIVTDNTNGQGDPTGAYGGTHVMNDAFLSRFSQWIAKGYPETSKWVEIVQTRTRCGRRDAVKIVKIAEEINKGSAALGASSVTTSLLISPRETIDVARLFKRFGSMHIAWNVAFVNSLHKMDPDRVHFLDVLRNIVGEEH